MNLFKDLVWDNLVDAAVIKLFAALPFLAVWPLNMITRYLVHEFADLLFNAADEFIDTNIIIIRNENAKRVYDTEAVKLKIIANGHGIDSEEFRNARMASRSTLRKFVGIHRPAA